MRQQLRDANNLIVSKKEEAATVYTPSQRTGEPKPPPTVKPPEPVAPPISVARPVQPEQQQRAALAQVPAHVAPEFPSVAAQRVEQTQSPAAIQTDNARPVGSGAVFSRASVSTAAQPQPSQPSQTSQQMQPSIQPSASQRTPSVQPDRGSISQRQSTSQRPAERPKSKGRLGLVLVVLIVVVGAIASWFYFTSQPPASSASKDADNSASSSGSTDNKVSGAQNALLSSAEHLERAKKFAHEGATLKELGEARDELSFIQESSSEYKEARVLEVNIERRMRTLGR